MMEKEHDTMEFIMLESLGFLIAAVVAFMTAAILYWYPGCLRKFMHDTKDAVIAFRTYRAHAWLRKHDQNYQSNLIESELVRRREAARARGASPEEIDQIGRFEVGKDLGLGPKFL